MKRIATLLYGTINYVLFLGVFLYLIGFLTGFLVPKNVNSGPKTPTSIAFMINILLLSLFGIQHTVMARPGFKSWWTRIVPKPMERSTYVLLTNICLVLLYWQWKPLPGVLWEVESFGAQIALYSLFGCGIGLVLVSTFLIDHFDLFGLRQVVLYFRGLEYFERPFRIPAFYKIVRHPLYVGWLISFWATPTMTTGHFMFAVGNSLYILIALAFEERDLVSHFGKAYRRYQESTPMLLPLPRKKRALETSR